MIKSKKYKIQNLLRRPGPLKEEFEMLGDTLVFPQPLWSVFRSKSFLIKSLSFLLSPVRLFFFKIKVRMIPQVDFVFLNTLTHGNLLKMLKKSEAKVITYVHELNFITTFYNKEEDVRFLLTNSHIIATPCQAVANYLTKFYELDNRKIKRLNYYVDLAHSGDIHQTRDWKVPANKFIVVGCGTIDLRKGFDLFYQTAYALKSVRSKSDFQFYWVGMSSNDSFSVQSFLDIQKLNLGELVTIVQETSNVFGYLKAANIFFLPSREDPYPVVVLEAALFSVPTICFENSGGIVEFVEEDAGWIVPYLDIQNAAQRINFLMDNRDVVAKAGGVAKEKVLNRHSAEIVKQQINNILN